MEKKSACQKIISLAQGKGAMRNKDLREFKSSEEICHEN
jgi:hypothetical protein